MLFLRKLNRSFRQRFHEAYSPFTNKHQIKTTRFHIIYTDEMALLLILIFFFSVRYLVSSLKV